MLTIAILDDQIEEAIQTKNLLLPYFEKRKLEYDRIEIFSNGKDLLHSKKHFDLLFLDIEVGEENGIEIAQQLRKDHPELIIIVVTSYVKYSMEGYKIQAARYLLKPIASSLLYSELDEVLKESLAKPAVLIQNEHNQRRIPIKDLYYFESYGRKVNFHTRSEMFLSKENVSYWSQRLSDDFVECYKGIYVNLNYVRSIDSDTIQLDNEQVLPLARRRGNIVREAWITYQEMKL